MTSKTPTIGDCMFFLIPQCFFSCFSFGNSKRIKRKLICNISANTSVFELLYLTNPIFIGILRENFPTCVTTRDSLRESNFQPNAPHGYKTQCIKPARLNVTCPQCLLIGKIAQKLLSLDQNSNLLLCFPIYYLTDQTGFLLM